MMDKKATYMLIITAIALVAFFSPIVLGAVWPISGTSTPDDLTSPFGPRMPDSEYDFHRGIDIHTGYNCFVYASEGGTVEYRRPLGGLGNFFVIYTAGYYKGYAHLSAFGSYNEGDQVSEGSVIGTSGGNPPHLHFDLLMDFFQAHQIRTLKLVENKVACTLKVPGDILDCIGLECIVKDKDWNTTTEQIWAFYEDIATWGLPAIDSCKADLDRDGDKDICFGPKPFNRTDNWFRMYVEFYLEEWLPTNWQIIVNSYGDDNMVQGSEELHGVKIVNTHTIPTEYSLSQNYPNPFNIETVIRFQLPKNDDVEIDIYNSLGQKIRTLLDKRLKPGWYEISWNSRDQQGYEVASGVYLYKVKAGTFSQTRKMILLK
jgi:murein DD-endopeptidase MepM/ murein hydrolase activator NlpD